jgi:hypothetical protein
MIGTIDSAGVRRGAIFLVNIGVPLVGDGPTDATKRQLTTDPDDGSD